MNLFQFFKPKVVEPIHDPLLGTLAWSAEDREYVGEFNGLQFSLSHGRSADLPDGLLSYASRVLTHQEILTIGLEREKARWIADHDLDLEVTEEIDALRLDFVAFYWHRGGGSVFASLVPESDRRSWRIEYKGDVCEGLGFDS